MGSKGGKTVILPQAQAQTSTVAPNPVALAAYQNVVGQAQGLQGQHLGFSPDQQAAFGEVNQLQGVANPWINQAGSFAQQGLNAGNQLIQQGANAGSPQNFGQNINAYMSPYLNDVVRATMANINETNAQQQSQLTGNAIAQSAMGGNRVGVAGAELARQQNMTNNSTLANILQAGYGQAGQNLFQNAGLQMQAGNSLGMLGNQTAGIYSGLGNEALSTGLQGANALLQTGGMQQALPYQQLGWLSGIVGNQGPNMGQTGSQNSMGYTSQYAPSPNPLNSLMGAGVAAAGMFLKDGGRVTKAHGGGLGEYDPSADDYDSPVGGGFGAIPQVKPTNTHGLQLPAFLAMQQAHQGQQEQGKDPSFGDWGKAGKGLGGAYDRYADRSAMDNFAADYANEPTIGASEWRGGRVRGYDEGGAVEDYSSDDDAKGLDTLSDEGRSTSGLGPILDEAHKDPVWQRIVRRESSGQHFNPDGSPKIGTAGEYGMAQIKPSTAQETLQSAGIPYDENRLLTDPSYNETAGYLYYKNQRDRYGNPSLGAAAYNAGPGRVDHALSTGNWQAAIPASTRAYVADVTGQPTEGGLGAITAAAGPGNGLAPVSEGRSADTGVAPPNAEPGFLERLGVPKISPDTRAALISAGLGMMASKSHWLGPAIGEGGLAGVKSYYENQQNTRQNLNTQSEIANRAGLLGVAQQRNRLTGQHLGLTAEQIRQQGEYQRGTLGLGTRKQDLEERQTNIRINSALAAAKAYQDYYSGLQSSSSPGTGGLQPAPQPAPAGGVGGGTGSVEGGGGGTGAVVPNAPVAPQGARTSGKLTPGSDPARLDQMAYGAELAAIASQNQGDTAGAEVHFKQAQSLRGQAERARTAGIGTDAATGASVPLPGAPETAYMLSGAKSKGEAAGKAEYNFKTVVDPETNAKYYQSEAQIHDALGNPQTTTIQSGPGAGSPPGSSALRNGGIMAESPASIGKSQDAVSDDEKTMGKEFLARQIGRQRFQAIANILTKYQTGKFAENKASMVAALRSVGIPVKNSDTANPAAFEQFVKNATRNVFSDVKDMGGRVLVAEITGLERATANPGLQPEAVKAIVGQSLGLYDYEDKYHDAYFDWRRHNKYATATDVAAFDSQWRKANDPMIYVKQATKKIGALGEQLPAPEDREEGQVYSIPANKEKGIKAHQRQWINRGWAPNPYQGNQ